MYKLIIPIIKKYNNIIVTARNNIIKTRLR